MRKMEFLQKLVCFAFVSVGGAAVLSGGCGGVGPGGVPTGITTIAGPSPAAPPAPPAELPTFLQVADIGISVDGTRSASAPTPDLSFLVAKGSASRSDVAALVGSGPLTTAIEFSANLVYFSQVFYQNLIAPLQNVLIPVGRGIHDLPPIALSITETAYLSFSAFDPSCSGNTRDLPICLQIWLDRGDGSGPHPYLEAVYTDYPRSAEFPGAGWIRGFQGDPITREGFYTAIQYDHSNPVNVFNDLAYAFVMLSHTADPELGVALNIRSSVRQEFVNGYYLKTVNGVSMDVGVSFGEGFGRWIEGQDYYAGTLFTQDGGVTTNDFKDVCARISTATELDWVECSSRGITTDGLDFLLPLTLDDLLLIAFPATP